VIPSHLAIIMDGNGRWAELHGRDRTFGHLKGARVAKQVIESCAEMGVKQLTLYAFSTENWLRPKSEVSFLMMLLGRHMRKERKSLIKNNIRFSVIGEIDRLPSAIKAEVNRTIDETAKCTGMSLTFALSYGSRQEITSVMQTLAREVAAGRLKPQEIDEELISKTMQSSFMPDPDLILRTSGEFRLSNFLLWQAAYSELFVTSTLWPDFTIDELKSSFHQFSVRERRFGRTTAQIKQIPIAELVQLTTARHASN
jgi:undecaprenyl diphosphate synthase